MKIRPIDIERDLEQTLAGMKDFISRMDYREFLPINNDSLISSLRRLLDLQVVTIMVADHEEKGIVGGIGMLYSPCVWNQDIIVGEELFWWVSKEAPKTTALRLLREVRLQARAIGCEFVTFKSLTSSPKGVDKLYRKMGLRPIETSYMGAL